MLIDRWRKIAVVIIAMVVANLACALNMSFLALADRERASFNLSTQKIAFKERVDIIDRNQVLLATNLNTFSVYADPKLIVDPVFASRQLAAILPGKLSASHIQGLLSAPNRRFVWLRRNLSPADLSAIRNAGIPGVFFLQEERRVYPQGPLLSHTIGMVDIDGRGIAGVENYFNTLLRSGTKDPLQLSIDLRVQHAARIELLKQVQEYDAQGGAAIVMNIKTGEVLAITSVPDFDPNSINKVSGSEMFNRATLGVYEIGSVFKTFIMAIALEEKLVTFDEQFDVATPVRIGHDHVTRDLYPIAGGKADIETIFKKSSNIGMVKIGMRVGGDRIKTYLEKFGFSAPVSIELQEKSNPLHPRKWSDAEVATISYGYGVAATIVHIAEAMAAVSNNGYSVKASLLLNPQNNEKVNSVISENTSKKMRLLLHQVVRDGSGKKAAVDGYCVGGKTGTSNKIIDGKYDTGRVFSSFAAVFPMYDPQYVIVVMVDDPRKEGVKMTGGLVAAPVAGKIIRRMGSFIDMSYDPVACEKIWRH